MNVNKLVKVAKVFDAIKTDIEIMFKKYSLDEEEKVITIGLIANEYLGEDFDESKQTKKV